MTDMDCIFIMYRKSDSRCNNQSTSGTQVSTKSGNGMQTSFTMHLLSISLPKAFGICRKLDMSMSCDILVCAAHLVIYWLVQHFNNSECFPRSTTSL